MEVISKCNRRASGWDGHVGIHPLMNRTTPRTFAWDSGNQRRAVQDMKEDELYYYSVRDNGLLS